MLMRSFASDILTVIDSLDSALNMINVNESESNEFMKKMKEGLTLVMNNYIRY